MTDPGLLSARFLVGPTAVGKTAVAQWIAEREGWDILSADSMLVYRGLDIGTDKPASAARGGVRYLGLDLAAPDRAFSAGEYRAYALRELSANSRQGRDTLVVGGTGLYVKSLTHGLDSASGVDPVRRQHWEELMAREGVLRLQAELRTRNPALFESIRDPLNARRLIRALELDEAGLKTAPAGWRGADGGGAPLAGLVRPGPELKRRMAARVEEMYRDGLLDEVRALLKAPGGLSAAARKAIGYEEAIEVLEGRCSEVEARQRTAARTWQLARRQMTWFRRQADVRWIEISEGAATADVARLVLNHWREGLDARPSPPDRSGRKDGTIYPIPESLMRVMDMPERIRPREEMERLGAANVSDDVLLAIILRTGVKGVNVVDLSRGLLRHFGSLTGLAAASVEDLRNVRGMGKVKAQTLAASLQLARNLAEESLPERFSVRTPGDAARLLEGRARTLDVEVFWSLHLDKRNRLIRNPVEISRGLLDASLVHPREVFRDAIRGATAAMVLAHNHPSGDPTPSAEDIRITRQLIETGKIVDIKVLDHVIIGRGDVTGSRGFLSLREEGVVAFD